jgi:hypothetical protein
MSKYVTGTKLLLKLNKHLIPKIIRFLQKNICHSCCKILEYIYIGPVYLKG